MLRWSRKINYITSNSVKTAIWSVWDVSSKRLLNPNDPHDHFFSVLQSKVITGTWLMADLLYINHNISTLFVTSLFSSSPVVRDGGPLCDTTVQSARCGRSLSQHIATRMFWPSQYCLLSVSSGRRCANLIDDVGTRQRFLLERRSFMVNGMKDWLQQLLKQI